MCYRCIIDEEAHAGALKGPNSSSTISALSHEADRRGTERVQTAGRPTGKEQQKKGFNGDKNMESMQRWEADGVHSALYLTIDVGAGVQKHLNHGLVPAHAGVHERGHSLWREQAEDELSLFYNQGSKSWREP